jgi:pimeloyl-ACP methyl ester carboxylesterase
VSEVRYRAFDVAVAGGLLRVGEWGDDGPVVLAVHGITANHRSWVAVAEAVGRDVRLVAPDLRGRGGSGTLPGPCGMEAHGRDLVAVLDALELEGALAVGHSMGAFVVAAAGARYPERFPRVLLVDGGLPLSLPPSQRPQVGAVDVDALLHAMLGPAMQRLAMRFPTRESYRAYWRQHPALEEWDERIWSYLDYDLIGVEPELRSGVAIDAVRDDTLDTSNAQLVGAAINGLAVPPVLLRAERGLANDAPLYSDAVVDEWPNVEHRMAVAANHYTILFNTAGVDAVAAEIRAAAPADPSPVSV